MTDISTVIKAIQTMEGSDLNAVATAVGLYYST